MGKRIVYHYELFIACENIALLHSSSMEKINKPATFLNSAHLIGKASNTFDFTSGLKGNLTRTKRQNTIDITLSACLLRFIETDHPANAKPVTKHTEVIAPKGFIHGHTNFSTCRKAVKEPIRFCLTVGVNRQ